MDSSDSDMTPSNGPTFSYVCLLHHRTQPCFHIGAAVLQNAESFEALPEHLDLSRGFALAFSTDEQAENALIAIRAVADKYRYSLAPSEDAASTDTESGECASCAHWFDVSGMNPVVRLIHSELVEWLGIARILPSGDLFGGPASEPNHAPREERTATTELSEPVVIHAPGDGRESVGRRRFRDGCRAARRRQCGGLLASGLLSTQIARPAPKRSLGCSLASRNLPIAVLSCEPHGTTRKC